MLLGTAAFFLLGIVLMNFNRVPLPISELHTTVAMPFTVDPYSEADIARLYAQRVNVGLFPSAMPCHPRAISIRPRHSPYRSVALCRLTRRRYCGVSHPAARCLPPFSWIPSPRPCAPRRWQLARLLPGQHGSVLYFEILQGLWLPLCVIAAWCFVREIRYGHLPACASLAFSHTIPDCMLFFLLAGGVYRPTRPTTTGRPSSLQHSRSVVVTHISPHGRTDSLYASAFSTAGGMNDPARSGIGSHKPANHHQLLWPIPTL